MKKIEAIIQPYKLEEVKEALVKAGVMGITLTDVKGFGRQKGKVEHYRGSEYRIDFLPKIKLEMVVADSIVDEVVKVVITAARMGKIGDGKVFVHSTEQAWRVRTGESGEGAL